MTLSLLPAWASNLNYSAGPDLGTPTKIDPSSTANGFIGGVVAAPQHVNYLFHRLAADLIKAIDGVNGGTYALQSVLNIAGPAAFHIVDEMEVDSGGFLTIFGHLAISDTGELDSGASFDVDGTIEINATGRIDVNSGGLIEVLSGGEIDVESGGDINIAPGGDINVQGGGSVNVESGGQILVQSGGAVGIESGGALIGLPGALVQVEDANDLAINNDTVSFRVIMTPIDMTYTAGARDFSNLDHGDLASWTQDAISGSPQIAFPIPMLPGDNLEVLTIYIQGGASGAGHVGVPAQRMEARIYKVSASGGITPVSAAVMDPVNSLPGYDAAHQLVMGSLGILADGQPLYVLITGEAGGNAVAGTTRINAIDGTIVARGYRGPNEIH